MTSPVAITAATNTLRLDDKRQSEAQFTVFNASGRPLRGRAHIVPQNPISNDWLTLVGPAEHDLVIAGTQQYVVRISVPPTAPAGSYPFRLDMVDASVPDENLTQGPTVTFVVPSPEPQKKSLPIWIPIAIVVAVLVIGGGIAAVVVTRTTGPDATPVPASTTTPVPTFTNTPDNTPTVKPPLVITRIDMSHSPVARGSICGRVSVTFQAKVTFTGSGTVRYAWSGDVSDAGALSVNCGSDPCTKSMPDVDVALLVPQNSERSVTASIRVEASNSVTATDEATYICGTPP